MIKSNQIEMLLGSGQTINLTSSDDLNAVLASYMRTIHGRNDLSLLHNQLNDQFESQIELVRSQLNSNHFSEAKILLSKISPLTLEEKIEVQLENARLSLFTHRLDEAKNLATDAFNKCSISHTKMTLSQLLGDIYLRLENYSKAEFYLDSAIEIGNHFPLLSATWNAHAFKILFYIKTQEYEKARNKIMSYYLSVKELKGDIIVDRLISFYRVQFHYFKALNQISKAIEVLLQCNELCLWCGDIHTLSRNQEDLALLEDREIATSFHIFNDWSYLPDIKIVLTKNPKKAINLDKHPIVIEFLDYLLEKEREVHFEEIFEALKNQKYDYDIHLQYVKNIIQRCRKLLPKNSILVKDNQVKLQ